MGDGGKSVITLQLGHYANHVGAHFWNIQEAGSEEVDRQVLFREGMTSLGSFTPRLVSVDLKGALGSLPVYGDLHPDGADRQPRPLWEGEVQVSRSDEGEGEAGIRVWSDFLKTRFHPRTNVVVERYHHDDVTANPYDVYGLGFNSDSFLLDGIEDGIRFFAEECDHLRGFHLILDSDSAFGGLAVKFGHILGEDYSSKTVLGFPVFPSLPEVTDDMKRGGLVPAAHCLKLFLNSALTLNGLSDVCSLITPMSVLKDPFPLLKTGTDHVRGLANVNYKGQVAYHSSALLASNLDALSMPWRSCNGWSSGEIGDVTKNLAFLGRKFASTSVALTLPMPERDGSFLDLLEGLDNEGKTVNSLTTSLTPGSHDVSSEVDSQSVAVRGIDPRTNLKRDGLGGRYHSCDDVGTTLFKHYQGKVRTGSVFAVESPLPTCRPFPPVFDVRSLGRTGFLSEGNVDECVDSVPVVSLWQSSEKGIGQVLKSYHQRASKINLRKLPKFIEAGLEQDEFLQNVDDLNSHADRYIKNDELY